MQIYVCCQLGQRESHKMASKHRPHEDFPPQHQDLCVCVEMVLPVPDTQSNYLNWRDSHGALSLWDCAYTSSDMD